MRAFVYMTTASHCGAVHHVCRRNPEWFRAPVFSHGDRTCRSVPSFERAVAGAHADRRHPCGVATERTGLRDTRGCAVPSFERAVRQHTTAAAAIAPRQHEQDGIVFDHGRSKIARRLPNREGALRQPSTALAAEATAPLPIAENKNMR